MKRRTFSTWLYAGAAVCAMTLSAVAACVSPAQINAAMDKLKAGESKYSAPAEASQTDFVRDLFKELQVSAKSLEDLVASADVAKLTKALEDSAAASDPDKREWDKRPVPAMGLEPFFARLQAWAAFGEIVIALEGKKVAVILPEPSDKGAGKWNGIQVPRIAYVGPAALAGAFEVKRNDSMATLFPDPTKPVFYRFRK